MPKMLLFLFFCSVSALASGEQKNMVRRPIKQALSTPRLVPSVPLNPQQIASRNQLPLQQQMQDDQRQADQVSGGFQMPFSLRPPSDLNNLVPITGPFAPNSNMNNMNNPNNLNPGFSNPAQSFMPANSMNNFNPVQLAQLNQLPLQQQLLQQVQAAQSQQAARQFGPSFNGMMDGGNMQPNENFGTLGPMAGVYGGQLGSGGLSSIGLGGMYNGNMYTARDMNFNGGGSETVCTCTLQYAPLCGSDGKTYPNKCNFDCAQRQNPGLQVTMESECSGSSNPRESDNNVSIQVYESPSFIPTDSCSWKCYGGSKPTCGSNGVTYSNECKFWRAVCRSNRQGITITALDCALTGTSSGSSGSLVKAPIMNLLKDIPSASLTSTVPWSVTVPTTTPPSIGAFSASNEISLRKLDQPIDPFFNKEINLKL